MIPPLTLFPDNDLPPVFFPEPAWYTPGAGRSVPFAVPFPCATVALRPERKPRWRKFFRSRGHRRRYTLHTIA